MRIFQLLRRVIISLVFVVAIIVIAGPWGLYWLGLQASEGKPSPPSVLASPETQLAAWKRVRGVGTPSVTPLNPYTYISDAVLSGPRPLQPSLLVAWTVASGHLLDHRKYKSMFWWHLSGASLTIWLTRNWTTEQLLTKVSESSRK
jgi:arginine exporter protein ArgO